MYSYMKYMLGNIKYPANILKIEDRHHIVNIFLKKCQIRVGIIKDQLKNTKWHKVD